MIYHHFCRRKAVWGPKRTAAALLFTFVCLAPSTAVAKAHQHQGASKQSGVKNKSVKDYKLDDELSDRSNGRNGNSTTRVIVTFAPGVKLPAEFRKYLRSQGNLLSNLVGNTQANSQDTLDLINGQVLDLPNNVLKTLAKHPSVAQIHYDRPIHTHNYRTAVTVGARTVQESLGYTGAGIGVAVIDSGISTWHDDLTNNTSKLFPYGNQRVRKFVDFVNGRALPYDDNGHGTHVAGDRKSVV